MRSISDAMVHYDKLRTISPMRRIRMRSIISAHRLQNHKNQHINLTVPYPSRFKKVLIDYDIGMVALR
jgi:hypothetical protein